MTPGGVVYSSVRKKDRKKKRVSPGRGYYAGSSCSKLPTSPIFHSGMKRLGCPKTRSPGRPNVAVLASVYLDQDREDVWLCCASFRPVGTMLELSGETWLCWPRLTLAGSSWDYVSLRGALLGCCDMSYLALAVFCPGLIWLGLRGDDSRPGVKTKGQSWHSVTCVPPSLA